ncbi:unnamed protein product, partial [Brenthis ino]
MTNVNSINGQVLVLNGNTPEDVAKALIKGGRQKEPFYIFDLDEAFRRIEHFQKMMPRVQIFYAIKSNDSDKMIKLAAALGLGFDCASPGEINKILKLNVSPQSIIFAIPTKTTEWMTYAREVGVRHTTFDTSYELKKIKQYWPNASLLLRIEVESDCLYKLGDKFGCDFETEAIDLLEEAAALHLKVVGVAFHVGSACSSIDSHENGIRQARALFDHEAKAGRKMYIVDIGGGFMSDHISRIDKVSKIINRTLDEVFPEPDIQIIAEPGRYICDSSMNLYCSINNIRRQVTKKGETVNMVYINDGIYGTLRFIEPWHKVKIFGKQSNIITEKLEKITLWGPSGDSTDQLMKNLNIFLPCCTPADWLVFDLQGAYTFVFSTRFSCLQIPLIRSVVSQKLWNNLKSNKAFDPEDFVTNQDLSTPLPSTLPPLINNENPLKLNHTLKL